MTVTSQYDDASYLGGPSLLLTYRQVDNIFAARTVRAVLFNSNGRPSVGIMKLATKVENQNESE